MQKQIEVFFDYVCPYCNKGIREFLKILPDYPEVEVIWRPCESHPRPELSPIHSDLAIAAMYYLQEKGGDLPAFHIKVYDAWFRDKKRIDNIELLASLAAECGGDADEVKEALKDCRYAGEVEKGNDYAWEECGLPAVPSYLCGGQSVLSENGILASIDAVKEMLN